MDATYFETRFGVTTEAIHKILAEALHRGGSFADLYFQHSTGTSVGLEDGAVNKGATFVDLGVGIRVVHGDQTGYAFSEELSLEPMLAAARTAAAIATGGGSPVPTKIVGKRLPRHYDTAWDWASVGVTEMRALLARLDEETRARDERIERVTASIGASQSRVLIVTSEGEAFFDSQPMTRLGLSVVMEQGGERQSNGHQVSARAGMDFYSDARLDEVVDLAVERTAILFEARRPPQGEMPVVLAAGSSGILLHEAMGHGMEADFNRKGISVFSDRIGKPVAESFVSIVDDGTNPGLRGSINVDDEGSPSQRTMLVENGILRSYLHDKISARHFGVEPTGNGRRQSFRHVPLPRMRNTYMLGGPHTKESIISSVKKGIYCVSFTNGQVSIGVGDYAFYVKNGWLIEDGKLTAPVKDVNIIGNGPETLSKITMAADDMVMDDGGWTCGKDGQSVPVSLGMPTCLVSGVTVGGNA